MTDAGVLEQVVLDIDLDTSPVCEHVKGCPNEAAWRFHCKACPSGSFACDSHYQSFLGLISLISRAIDEPCGTCSSCGTEMSFRELLSNSHPV